MWGPWILRFLFYFFWILTISRRASVNSCFIGCFSCEICLILSTFLLSCFPDLPSLASLGLQVYPTMSSFAWLFLLHCLFLQEVKWCRILSKPCQQGAYDGEMCHFWWIKFWSCQVRFCSGFLINTVSYFPFLHNAFLKTIAIVLVIGKKL